MYLDMCTYSVVKEFRFKGVCAIRVFVGYMCCFFVLDKDGVSVVVISVELVSFLVIKNLFLF